ncbi:hypothetical protein D1013_08960 [Euzebyella marina]|uniref:C-type lectin domain-containing protein n=1 Tax=Euzebyella marina TaxID=1761453 RepID=A0A3G2L5L6_9FLAO|nr:gliding motility-associated C-terminal domain-containing protein [Euzebyella marina]AYN67481.1 hypothetical protein D1013_08960 [Euzebyella marina]
MTKLTQLFRPIVLLLSLGTIYAQNDITVSGDNQPNAIEATTATIVAPNLNIEAGSNITDFTVSITNSFTPSDQLGYNGGLPAGISTAGWNSNTRSIVFKGTLSPSEWQAFLRNVTITSGPICSPESRKISFVAGETFYNPLNGHFYRVTPNPSSWTDAKTLASSTSYYGREGYLVTLTDAAENTFVTRLIGQDSWMGASDDHDQINQALGYNEFANTNASEGQFFWVTGPEKGTQLTTANAGTGGNEISGVYQNWRSGEPNDYNNGNPGESFGHVYSSAGDWNDFPNTSSIFGIMEFGDMPYDQTSATPFFTKNININGAPGGTITGGEVSVCYGSNSTTLTLIGLNGTVVRWESSDNNFIDTPMIINNTSTSLVVNNISRTTYYRAIVNTNAPTNCNNLTTSSTPINVSEAEAGNVFAQNTTICAGSNVELFVSGQQGEVQKWQRSSDNTNWTDIAHTQTTLDEVIAGTGTYFYRVVTEIDNCGFTDISPSKEITVVSGTAPEGGEVSSAVHGSTTNSGTLTLTGYTGTITKWQRSTDEGIIWSDISNTSNTYSYSNVANITMYRAVLTNGSCGIAYSDSGSVTIAPTNNPPTVTSTSITSATAESLYYYDIKASDADNDVITWMANNVPTWLTFTSGTLQTSFVGTGATPSNMGDGVNQSPDGTSASATVIRTGTAAYGDNKLFFTDTEEYGIRYVDESGNVQTWYQGDGTYTNLNPLGIAYDVVNNAVYVGDYAKSDIVKIDNMGTRTLLSDLPEPFILRLLVNSSGSKLYASARGGIYEIDLANNNPATNWTRVVGTGTMGYSDTGTASTSQVSQPHGMAFDNAGRLVFTDRFNDIIRRVNLSTDTIETIAGTQGAGSEAGDGGPAVNATFADPSGLAINEHDEIFISERLSKRIRKIDINGNINTFFTVSSGGFADDLVISDTGELYLLTTALIAQVATKAELSGTPTNADAGVHDVELTLSDGKVNVPYNFQITVQAINIAPTDIALNNNSINQSATGLDSTVGTLSTIDADSGDSHTYSLIAGTGDTDNASFNINGTTLRTNSTLAAGNYNIRINTNDGTDDFTKEFTVSVNDDIAPEGYTVSIDQDPVVSSNQSSISFTFASAEVGATYNYTFSSDGGGTDVTGSGTITTSTDKISNIDLGALGDGTISLSVTLTDANNNVGTAATDLAEKDTIAPVGYTVSIDQASINPSNETSVSFTLASAELGSTYNYTFSSDGGVSDITGAGTISSTEEQISGIDLSGLNDGTITLTVALTDDKGNAGIATTDTVHKDTTAPVGYTVAFDQASLDVSNESSASFTFTGAEIGANYQYSFSSEGGGTNVTGTGTITSSTDQISDIDLSVLGDGMVTLTVSLTDNDGNTGINANHVVNKDTDTDDDGVRDDSDNCPDSANTDQSDTDNDGEGNVCDIDDDNDGTPDSEDAFPLDKNEDTDTDGDGTGDNEDTDDDGDGTPDTEDDFPLDGNEDTDTDGDGTGDNTDTDDDGDGTPDTEDDFPLDGNEDTDTDGDGTGDNSDEDDDNDGYPDDVDDLPHNPNEYSDIDGDGIGDNEDTDDDNDGEEDVDTDGDGLGDNVDEDDDNDGVVDGSDDFPLDETEQKDTDSDGTGDNADTDDDGDGYTDQQENESGTDSTDPIDTPADNDNDGIPDNRDDDDDNDGVPDSEDYFPQDNEPVLVPAEAFTPNNDGLNDSWMVPGIENYPNNVVRIYNRYGHEVFAQNSYRNDWQGFFKNKNEKLPSGSYLYIIDLGNGEAPLRGWIFINY